MGEITKGSHPPAGLHGGSSQSGQYAYVYGGKHGSDHSGLLFQLDTVAFMWTKLADCHMEGPVLKYGVDR